MCGWRRSRALAVPSEDIELLAEDILGDIELGKLPLAAVMLKCARLARWLGDEPNRQIFAYEAGGYTSTATGIPQEVFELGRIARRVTVTKDKTGSLIERMNARSVDSFEQRIHTNRIALASAIDRDVSVSSANPHQVVNIPWGNGLERKRLTDETADDAANLARSRAYAYEYATAVLYQSRFSDAASTIFDRIRNQVNVELVSVAPAAAQKVAAIHDNLASSNPEDWANAVHSCRRLLQQIADTLFAATTPQERNGKTIQLGSDNYVNRLMCYVEDRSSSSRFTEIVGSTLAYMGERLDAVFKAAQKGSHSDIKTREEAERYVIYTFLAVADILSLNAGSVSE